MEVRGTDRSALALKRVRQATYEACAPHATISGLYVPATGDDVVDSEEGSTT